jgi:hypothetical protein
MAKTLDGLQGDEGSNLDTNNCILDVWWPYMSCMFIKYELYIYQCPKPHVVWMMSGNAWTTIE